MTSLAFIAHKRVILTTIAAVAKHVHLVNVAQDAIQAPVQPGNCVKMALASLDVVTTWIVRRINHVLTVNVLIHVHNQMHVDKIHYVKYPSIVYYACVPMAIRVNPHKAVAPTNVVRTAIVNSIKVVTLVLAAIHAYRIMLVELMHNAVFLIDVLNVRVLLVILVIH